MLAKHVLRISRIAYQHKPIEGTIAESVFGHFLVVVQCNNAIWSGNKRADEVAGGQSQGRVTSDDPSALITLQGTATLALGSTLAPRQDSAQQPLP
jgi:hypothetical protein